MSSPPSKSVLEMSINGDEPSQQYIVKDSSYGSPACDASPGEVPIIDVGLFLPSSSPDPEALDLELKKLKSALTKEGCFQAIGHGISNSVLDQVRETAVKFFELPEEEKLKYSRSASSFEGYGNDVVVSDNQVLDWNYRIFLQVLPQHSRKLHLWPPSFREILHEYAEAVIYVMEVLYKAMAKSLNVEEDSFLRQFGEWPATNTRVNFYPPCSRPDMVLGVKAHSDGSSVTVLLQDKELEGLQILVDDKWVKVPVLPHALLVNLGDQMQIMSNGIFKSPMHRVVTNSERTRISLAMFHIPEVEAEIGPVDALIDEDRPKLYRNINNYGAINYECYQKGIVPIDTVKI